MTIQHSILTGSLIVALAIIGAKIIAPYQIAGVGGSFAVKINTLSGQLEVCGIQPGAYTGTGESHICR